MRTIGKVVFFFLITFLFFLFLEADDLLSNLSTDKGSELIQEDSAKDKPLIQRDNIPMTDDLFAMINMSTDELIDRLGSPMRRDLSAYGYTWWVYTNETNEYIQFGISGDRIQTIYVIGGHLTETTELIHQSYEQINKQFPFAPVVTYRNDILTYKFKLTEEDQLQRPLVQIEEDKYVQFYFDRFTNKLSSFRVLTSEVLLKQRPYEMEYRGEIPQAPTLSAKEWEMVEKGAEQQIFMITNIIRSRHEKKKLDWDEAVKKVAYAHSKDMYENDYFSHDSPDGRGLKDRLGEKDIRYQSAGENIAAGYPDGPAAVEGWLNSKGHREALLADGFTHLGVGVNRFYYTQSFIKGY